MRVGSEVHRGAPKWRPNGRQKWLSFGHRAHNVSKRNRVLFTRHKVFERRLSACQLIITKDDGISGTPSFLLNGAKLEGGAWNQIKGKLVEAGAR